MSKEKSSWCRGKGDRPHIWLTKYRSGRVFGHKYLDFEANYYLHGVPAVTMLVLRQFL
jgi:hypothetical protein